jgi:hypothetical protein
MIESELLHARDMSVEDNRAQSLYEFDRCTDDGAFAQWARRWGRPLVRMEVSQIDEDEFDDMARDLKTEEAKADSLDSAIDKCFAALETLWEDMNEKDDPLRAHDEIAARILNISGELENAQAEALS